MAGDTDRSSQRRQFIFATFLLGAVITGVWVVSFFVDLIDADYEAPASVHALMMLVAGAVFGSGFWSAVRGEVRNGKHGSNGRTDGS